MKTTAQINIAKVDKLRIAIIQCVNLFQKQIEQINMPELMVATYQAVGEIQMQAVKRFNNERKK